MNKKLFVLIGCICLYCSSAFAITDQIAAAKNFLDDNQVDNITANNSIMESQTTAQPTTVDNQTNDLAIAPKKEIKYGQYYPLLKEYQKNNGLLETGIFDKETLRFVQKKQKELGFNVTHTLDFNTWFATFNQSKIWQKNVVENGLKQWSDILDKQKQSNKSRFVVVDIPSMTLHAYDWSNDEATEILVSKVIVGKVTTETPEVDFSITGIKYHPTWTPTSQMLKKDLFKNGKLNTKWLLTHHIKAIDQQGEEISYNELPEYKNVKFIQPAGNTNALGILKFETTSKDNIYLHDTNERYLFSHNTRTYSSGCVRVQSFEDLAKWVGNMDDSKLDEKLNDLDTRIERVKNKVPVYFTYSQVYFKDGNPIFSPDIYNHNNNTMFE